MYFLFSSNKNKQKILTITILPAIKKEIRKSEFSFKKKAHNKGPVKLESPIKFHKCHKFVGL